MLMASICGVDIDAFCTICFIFTLLAPCSNMAGLLANSQTLKTQRNTQPATPHHYYYCIFYVDGQRPFKTWEALGCATFAATAHLRPCEP